MDILACTSTWCSFSNGDQRIIPLQCRILCLNFDGQSVVEPNDPSSRCLSPFPWHVTITTPTQYGMPVKHKISPQYFHQALLTIHQYSFILLGEERHCETEVFSTTQHKDPALTLHILTSVCIFSILFSIDFLRCLNKENLLNNQELLQLVITSFILMTLMCDSGLILLEEIRCQSPLWV